MVPEILNGWLWQSRLAMRTSTSRAFAAHGYVDPSYRPPRLPFASVVGPLSLAVEPEREPGKAGTARVRIPGFVVGQVRAPAATVPANGNLHLRFDGITEVTLALAGLPVTPFSSATTGPAIALAIQTAITNAIAGNKFTNLDGTPLTNPDVLALLPSISVRWSAQTRQLAIASDPGSAATGERSLVEILPATNDLAPALGFSPPASKSEGRQRLHKIPAPRSMTMEMRLDLWTQSQPDMALMFDGLANAAPTRGRLLLRPSLLAADVVDGATTLRLLDRGEPTTIDSLVHLEGGDGLTDRAKGIAYAASAGATSDVANSRFTITGAGQLTGPVWISPLVPDPLFATSPAPAGFAVAMGIQLAANAANGDNYALLALRRGATTVFSATLSVVSVNVPGSGPTLFGTVTATATLNRGVDATATTTWRILLTQLQAGGTLHARVPGDTGIIELAWSGEQQRLDDPLTTTVQPTAAPGNPTLGADMVLTIGGGGAAQFPRPVQISHVHIEREPNGPLDPNVRTSVTGPVRLRPGDMIAIATTNDGWRIGDTKSLSLVDSVAGSVVTLTKPIQGAFGRGAAVVFADECFFFQTAVKRRDDLLNRLYHCSVDYRVSALLEDPIARSSAVLVLSTREEVEARGASRAAGGHPGVTARDGDPVRTAN